MTAILQKFYNVDWPLQGGVVFNIYATISAPGSLISAQWVNLIWDTNLYFAVRKQGKCGLI